MIVCIGALLVALTARWKARRELDPGGATWPPTALAALVLSQVVFVMSSSVFLAMFVFFITWALLRNDTEAPVHMSAHHDRL